MTKLKEPKKQPVQIPPPKWEAIRFVLQGTSPYLQAPRKRDTPYQSPEGWNGIPCISLREAITMSARLLGQKWRHGARLGIFVEPDGFDEQDGLPLVRVRSPKPRPYEEGEKAWEQDAHVYEDWKAEVVIRYDADMFSAQDVVQLMLTTGIENGIGAHRPQKGARLASERKKGGEFGTFQSRPK